MLEGVTVPREIDPITLSGKLSNGKSVCLLDVRQPWEYGLARLPESVLIPLNELATRFGEVKVPEGGEVIVYCHHGIRSLRGAAFLEAQGIVPVASLAGGIDAWSVLVDGGVPRY